MSLKSLFKNSAIYAIATYLQRLIGFILMPFFTRPQFLPVDDYGDFNLIYTFIAFTTIVFTLGQDAAFLRFRFHKDEKPQDVFITSFVNLLSLSLIFGMIIFLFREQVQFFMTVKSSDYIVFAILILTFDVLNNSLYNYLRAEERAVSYSSIKIIRFAIELLLNFIAVVVLKKGIYGILYANLATTAVSLVVLALVCRKSFTGKFVADLSKQMLLFGLPFLPNGIAFIGTAFSDRIIISHFLTKQDVAYYSACFKWGTIIQFLVLAFRNAWQPYFLKVSKENPKEAPQVFARVLKILFIGLTLIWIPGALFVGEVIKYPFPGIGAILGDPGYWQAIHILPPVMLAYVYYGFYVSFTPGFYIKKKGHSLAIVTISGFMVSLLFNILLIGKFGYMAAAWANLTAYTVMSVLIVLWGQRLYYIPVEWKFIFKVILIQIIVLVFYYTIYPGILIKIFLLIAIIIVIFWLRLITKKEILTLLNLLRRGENNEK